MLNEALHEAPVPDRAIVERLYLGAHFLQTTTQGVLGFTLTDALEHRIYYIIRKVM